LTEDEAHHQLDDDRIRAAGGAVVDAVPRLPSAEREMVTMLLTDIEGSTVMWESHPTAMQRALARHEELVAEVVSEHGGKVHRARGEGDSTFSVFGEPRGALVAAVALQRAFAAEPWPEPIQLRIRVAVHTGPVEHRSNDYFGRSVNRCARLREAAHGGQTLVSAAVKGIVGPKLPDGSSLESLGLQKLKDLPEPEHVFQLCHPSLRSDFPPLRSADAVAGNLPLQMTSFVGRQDEIAELRGLLQDVRLVTLSGAGGCGKSRLALEVVRDLAEPPADGVWLVELSSLRDPALVGRAIAHALGLREEHVSLAAGGLASTGGRLGLDLAERLRGSQMLIVLDNCEHLVDACAEVCAALLASCSGIKIVATSRETLGVPGEVRWRVPSLSVPEQDCNSVDELMRFESARLFVDRVRLGQLEFTPRNGDAQAVARICRYLDGLPLAIELAAARVPALTVSEVAKRLTRHLRVLSGGARTAPKRQQTIQAAIEWSYELLTEREKVVFRRLAAFRGGFTIEAAERIVADDEGEASEIVDLLSRLVDKSLVVPEATNGDSRYGLLQVVHDFAVEMLAAAGERERVRAKHFAVFAELAAQAEPQLLGANQASWMDVLEREHDNMRSALDWAAGYGKPSDLLSLANSLWRFWYVRGYVREGRRHLANALARDDRSDPHRRAVALVGAGRLADADRVTEVARALLEEAVGLSSEVNDDPTRYLATVYLSQVFGQLGDHEDARRLGEEALALVRTFGDDHRLSLSMISTGRLAYHRADYALGRERLQEGIEIARRSSDHRNVFVGLFTLGELLRDLGELDDSRARLLESGQIGKGVVSVGTTVVQQASLARTLAHAGELEEAQTLLEGASSLAGESGIPLPIEWLDAAATVALLGGDPVAAADLGVESLHRILSSGERRRLPDTLDLIAIALVRRHEHRRALQLFGAAERIRDCRGGAVAPVRASDRQKAIAAARAGYGAGADDAWSAGVLLEDDALVAVATGGVHVSQRSAS